MAQSVALQSAPVELELDPDPEYDHYYGFDQSSATALASQNSDTLGASASALGPPGPQPSSAAWETSSLSHDYDTDERDVQQPLSLSSEHEASQGQGQQPSQPYHPESVPVHAAAPSPPHPASLHNSRSTRSYSVAASLASVGSQSSIRRKPLSPTASPLAVRFSSRLNGHHTPLQDLQHPDSGYYSLDSPDLYDLSPNKQEHTPAPVPAPTLASEHSLPTPLPEESDEDE